MQQIIFCRCQKTDHGTISGQQYRHHTQSVCQGFPGYLAIIMTGFVCIENPPLDKALTM